jgi:hypothetical protein
MSDHKPQAQIGDRKAVLRAAAFHVGTPLDTLRFQLLLEADRITKLRETLRLTAIRHDGIYQAILTKESTL